MFSRILMDVGGFPPPACDTLLIRKVETAARPASQDCWGREGCYLPCGEVPAQELYTLHRCPCCCAHHLFNIRLLSLVVNQHRRVNSGDYDSGTINFFCKTMAHNSTVSCIENKFVRLIIPNLMKVQCKWPHFPLLVAFFLLTDRTVGC